jgi:hypothetical protein
MPDLYGPFTGQTWLQSQWFRDAWARSPSGVFGPSFGVSTAGDLALTVAGLTATMGLGRAHVRGAGYERTGTAWSYAVPANTATTARVDRLVLRRDLAAGTVLPTVLQGTPAASPAAPALTRVEDGVWDLPLFRFTVPANSGAPLTGIVDDRVPGGSQGPGPLLTTGPLVAVTGIATGWALNAVTAQRLTRDLAQVAAEFTRTGAAITVGADGEVTNTSLGRLPAAWGGVINVPMQSTATGPVTLGEFWTDGTFRMTSRSAGANIATNDVVQLTTSAYPLADAAAV